MKKLQYYILAVLAGGTLMLSSCSDDSTPGTGGGDGNTGKTCKILKSTDDDGETTTYTWDGDNLTKIEEKDSFGTYTTNFMYENGKLKSVEEDESEIYELVYTGDDVTRVNIKDYDDKELYGYMTYTRTSGKVTQIDVYEVYEAPETDSIVEQYMVTFSGNNVSKVDMTVREDGKLESAGTITITGVDTKKNPFYGFPTLFSGDYDDVSVLNMNNMTSASFSTPFGPIPFSVSYEYNADGYPTKMTTSALGESTVTTVDYKCE